VSAATTQTATPEAVSFEIERQVQRLEAVADPAVRTAAMELVSSVLQFHGEALAAILRIVEEKSSGSAELVPALEHDPLVRSVLLLHGLHSQPVEVRVDHALADFEPTLKKYGAVAELLRAGEEGITIKLRIEGSHSCGSTAETVRSLLERRLAQAVPDAAELIIELPEAPTGGFVPINALQSATAEE
jgi:Fe-S cluster biogenesis protein NfuA